MTLKKKYFFNQMPEAFREHHSNWIRQEVKGSDLRKIFASSSRNQRRPKTLFMHKVFESLRRNNCRLISRVFIKGVSVEIKGTAIYSASIQSFYAMFQNFLEAHDSRGMIIGDSRDSNQNSQVSHSIFSKKMSSKGDDFSRIIEMPAFAHSENSAGLQLADLLASGIIWPIAIETFCKPLLQSIHIRNYESVKESFLEPLSRMQYRYMVGTERRGGITIANRLSHLPPACFFKSQQDIDTRFAHYIKKIRE